MNHHEFKGVPIPPEGLEVERVLGKRVRPARIVAVISDNYAITENGELYLEEDLRLTQKKKRIPMSPKTCPRFPWAIRHPDWGSYSYRVVEAVGENFIRAVDRYDWEDLADGYLDHATGEPLYLEVDE